MNKYCTNCGNKLPENAGMCVKCGKMIEEVKTKNTNNKKKFPVWAIILIIFGSLLSLFIGLIVLFGVILSSDEFDDVIDDFPDIIEQRGTVGDTLYSEDYKITLNKVLKYDTIGEGDYALNAEDGKEYLLLFFEVENISSDTVIISSYNFNGYVDGYSVPYEYIPDRVEDMDMLSATLSPGMKTKGYIAYMVDKDWQDFEAHIKGFSFDDMEDITFNITNGNDNLNGV